MGGQRKKPKDSGKHLTAVLCGSASGLMAPLFCIAEGQNNMASWYEPLDDTVFKFKDGTKHPLARKNWRDRSAVVTGSQKGSMQMRIMPNLVQHINRYIRQYVPKEKRVVLLMDSHSSRCGLAWLEKCEEYKIYPVRLPANTTSFFQPCHQHINKKFKTEIRRIRDE